MVKTSSTLDSRGKKLILFSNYEATPTLTLNYLFKLFFIYTSSFWLSSKTTAAATTAVPQQAAQGKDEQCDGERERVLRDQEKEALSFSKSPVNPQIKHQLEAIIYSLWLRRDQRRRRKERRRRFHSNCYGRHAFARINQWAWSK